MPATHPEATGGYRRDIDGLRAVAIIAVVAHHAGIPGFPGGFVGVDVFFVISGYLITSILASEAGRSGRISLPAFYARRVRRLFPAMIVMVLASCLLGAIVLLPVFGQQAEFGRSAIATALYVSNFYFWLNSPGYFDPSADLMPLPHTWSLAVEEQFYIVWPPMILAALAAARRGQWRIENVLKALVAVILAASLGWCVAETLAEPTAAFYLLPARGWELATGAALALWMPAMAARRPLAGAACSVAGLLAVIASITAFHQGSMFPGYLATLPVFGTALIILGGRLAERNAVQRFLSTRPMVGIGLLSYSWYLWHWPLMSLTRAYELEMLDPARDAGIALLALLVAYASYRYVENPVRFGRPGPFRRDGSTLAAGAVASLAICLAAGALIVRSAQEAGRPSLEALAVAKADHSPLRATCHQDLPFKSLAPAEACTVGDPGRTPSLMLWGDSHAEHLSPLMQAFAESQPAMPVLVRSFSRCPPVSGFVHDDARVQAGCRAFNAAVLAEARTLHRRGLEGVVLSGRWLRVFGAPELDRMRGAAGTRSAGLASPGLAEGLEDMVGRLTSAGLEVVIVAPLPELPYDVPGCLARRPPEQCDVERTVADAQRRDVMRLLEGIRQRFVGVQILDFMGRVCDVATCYAERGGEIYFRDDHHLTARASRELLPAARAALAEAATPAPIS